MSDRPQASKASILASASLSLGIITCFFAFPACYYAGSIIIWMSLPGFVIGIVALFRIGMSKKRLHGIASAVWGIVLSLCVVGLVVVINIKFSSHATEGDAGSALKQMVIHQAVFRRTDADRNGLQDYWTADIAGFYATEDTNGTKLKYIDIALARADVDPMREIYNNFNWDKPKSKAGYFCRAIYKNAEGVPYRQDPDGDGKSHTNLSQWATCAFPETYNADGRNTFIVNEEGVVYEKDIGGNPVDQWPGAAPTKRGWAVRQ